MLQPFTVNRNNHHHNRISTPKRIPERERYFWVTFSIVLLTNLMLISLLSLPKLILPPLKRGHEK